MTINIIINISSSSRALILCVRGMFLAFRDSCLSDLTVHTLLINTVNPNSPSSPPEGLKSNFFTILSDWLEKLKSEEKQRSVTENCNLLCVIKLRFCFRAAKLLQVPFLFWINYLLLFCSSSSTLNAILLFRPFLPVKGVDAWLGRACTGTVWKPSGWLGRRVYKKILGKLNSFTFFEASHSLLTLPFSTSLSAPSWILTAIKVLSQRLWILILDQSSVPK